MLLNRGDVITLFAKGADTSGDPDQALIWGKKPYVYFDDRGQFKQAEVFQICFNRNGQDDKRNCKEMSFDDSTVIKTTGYANWRWGDHWDVDVIVDQAGNFSDIVLREKADGSEDQD